MRDFSRREVADRNLVAAGGLREDGALLRDVGVRFASAT
ncbi:hypothetical protein LILAB_31880 [Corallococcus macrosporus]|uniref:Uncharacterized protein n=1 Tax=Myxococcus fulvus (strain ATCC BAA-855 / HW-1) TaxID=483219 RepID=F8C8D0_MYXFH|nr:hypothetical protein LILAB_31880 [Corallococcus macrosporus]